jgi:hypothetical protein
VLVAVCVLATFGIAAHVAIGLVSARQHWRGGRLDDLVGLQAAVGNVIGRPLRDRAQFVDALPATSDADEFAVLGDCDAVYVGTGETHGAWIPVDHRDRRFRLEIGDAGVRAGSTSLMWFSSYTLRRLQVQVNPAGQLRLVLDVVPGDAVAISVADDSARNRFIATASVERSGQRSVVGAPMTEWNRQFRTVSVVPSVALNEEADAERLGLRVSTEPTHAPALCDRFR